MYSGKLLCKLLTVTRVQNFIGITVGDGDETAEFRLVDGRHAQCELRRAVRTLVHGQLDIGGRRLHGDAHARVQCACVVDDQRDGRVD